MDILVRKSNQSQGQAELLLNIYRDIKDRIDSRLLDFKRIFNEGSEEDFFSELVFCILTPQSKARQAEKVMNALYCKDLLFKAGKQEISNELNLVRFKNHKAGYIVLARNLCLSNEKLSLRKLLKEAGGVEEKRAWLVENVKGIGFKEASHFLRNTGLGEGIAILDRHILRNLHGFGIINELPGSLSEKKYLDIEKRMNSFALEIDIPIESLDFVLWYKETGDIFK